VVRLREKLADEWLRSSFSLGRLLTNAKFADNDFVALGVVFLEVVEQTPPFAHQHEEPPPGRVILFVGLEVLVQLADALAEYRDLHFGTSSVGTVRTVLIDDALFTLSG
jgi:hypothetical protein